MHTCIQIFALCFSFLSAAPEQAPVPAAVKSAPVVEVSKTHQVRIDDAARQGVTRCLITDGKGASVSETVLVIKGFVGLDLDGDGVVDASERSGTVNFRRRRLKPSDMACLGLLIEHMRTPK